MHWDGVRAPRDGARNAREAAHTPLVDATCTMLCEMEVPAESEVAKRVEQIMEVARQVPEYIIEDMEEASQHRPQDGELVGLIRQDGQDTMEEVV